MGENSLKTREVSIKLILAKPQKMKKVSAQCITFLKSLHSECEKNFFFCWNSSRNMSLNNITIEFFKITTFP